MSAPETGRRRVAARLLRASATLLLTVLAGGLAGATLVRVAPGFDVDPRELDPRLGGESRTALRRLRESERNIARFYAGYLARMLRGDLGRSRALGRPVAELLAERAPATARSLAVGLAAGWALALAPLLAGAAFPRARLEAAAGALCAALLCAPAAALALLFLAAGAPPDAGVAAGIALVIFPRVDRYARGVLAQASRAPHVLMARARGLPRRRVFLLHTFLPAAPALAALAGVSVSAAAGAAIPLEVICDSYGLGQLAWQAAQQRDLPLLVNIGVGMTMLSVLANAIADLAGARR
jgi:peptide/nickel transport system permease protein